MAARPRPRRPRTQGSVAASASLRGQHAVVAAVLPRGRLGGRGDHRGRDRRRRSLSPLAVEGGAPSMTNDGPPADFDVAVVGAGQAGLAIGYFLARQGRRFVILEAYRLRRRRVAQPVELARPLHASALRQPSRDWPSPATPTATRGATRSSPTSRAMRRRSRSRSSLAPRSSRWRCRADAFVLRARRPVDHGRPGRRRHRAVPDAAHPRLSRPSSRPRSSRPTAPATGRRATSRRGRSWSSAAVTPAIRSRPSSRRHTACTSPSAAGSGRFRRGSWAATCSGGSGSGAAQGDRGLAARAEVAPSRRAHRLEPARAQASRSGAEASTDGRLGPRGRLSRTGASSRSTR